MVVHQPVYALRAEDEHGHLRGHRHGWAYSPALCLIVCELSSCVDGLQRRLWCVQAGTALSSRIRREAPNSVNLLRCGAADQPLRGRLERWDYRSAGGAGRFEVARTSELVPDRALAR